MSVRKKQSPVQESFPPKKRREYWKEVIFKELSEDDKRIIEEVNLEDLTDMSSYVEFVMETISVIIVDQQKVLESDLHSQEEERRTRDRVIQSLLSFSTYGSTLLCHLWERKEKLDRRLSKAMTLWISRQAQLVINAIRSMREFLGASDVRCSVGTSVEGPKIEITLMFSSLQEKQEKQGKRLI
ncbi:MAG: hypothetical protein RDV48_31175 [Candidatus Eremiobacteraeota bacterium]|nr:hypothetical protein [Candidatus Eremiobacteraeota bacterium]